MLVALTSYFGSKNRMIWHGLSVNNQADKKTSKKRKKVLQFPERLGILIHVAETSGGHERVLRKKEKTFS